MQRLSQSQTPPENSVSFSGGSGAVRCQASDGFRVSFSHAEVLLAGVLQGRGRKKTPRLWVSLCIRNYPPVLFRPFCSLAHRTPCSRLLPCDLDDACRAVKPARSQEFSPPLCGSSRIKIHRRARAPLRFARGAVQTRPAPSFRSGVDGDKGSPRHEQKRKELHNGKRTWICL